MIGMLVFNEAGRRQLRPAMANDCGQFNRVSRPDFQMRIAVKLDEFHRCAENRRSFFCLGNTLFRLAAAG